MGLIQIGASILVSLLIGALTRVAPRMRPARLFLLLAASILAVYWFQPLVPLRSFDFWFPSLTLALVVMTWFIISRGGDQDWRSPQNFAALALIAGLPAIIALSRYVLPDPVFTATTPPPLNLSLFFLITLA